MLVNRRALSTLRKIIVVVVVIAVISGVAYNLRMFNRPPKASFTYRTPTRTLKYIAPTDRDLIMFTNESTDPETPPEKLICNWYVRYNGTGDWKLLNTSRDHWGKLPVSNEKGHEIKLIVSDGMKEDSTSAILPVDPAYVSQYTEKKLGISIKGIGVFWGERFAGEWGTPPSYEEIKESLTVIRNELRCTAIRIISDYEDTVLQATRLALEQQFDKILVSPRYRRVAPDNDTDIEEHARRVIAFSEKVEATRGNSNSLILAVGNELTLDVRGIYDGTTMGDRVEQIRLNQGKKEFDDRLNLYLKKIIEGVRKNYRGKITYCQTNYENVNWKDLGFDVVGMNRYFMPAIETEQKYIGQIGSLKDFGKPVYITETGSATYEGVGLYGGGAWHRYKGEPYSQEEQAKNIAKNIELISKGGADAVFLLSFLERQMRDEVSGGILRYYKTSLHRRKLGFYAYQSLTMN